MEDTLAINRLLEESHVLIDQGEPAQALTVAARALDIARTIDSATTAKALVGLAHVRFRLGQYPQVRALASEALSLIEEDRTPESTKVRTDIFQVLGNCATETNSFAEAEEYYRQASSLARESGYVRGRIAAMHGLANNVYFPRGQFDLALAFEEETEALIREHGLQGDLIFPLMSISMICLATGQNQRAGMVLDELSEIAVTQSFAQGYCFCLKAELALKDRDLTRAQELYAEAQKISDLTGEPWLNINQRLGMSRYQRISGNHCAARDWATDALTFARRVGYEHEEGKSLVERARALWLCDDIASAEVDLLESIRIFEKLQAAFDLARARFLLAALLENVRNQAAPLAWRQAVKALINGGYAFFIDQERDLAFPLIAAHLNDPDLEIAHVSAMLLERFKAVPPIPLRIITFGTFKVYQGKRVIPSDVWKRRRAGELLRLLLTSPGYSLHREQICEALWPDRQANSAIVLFHQSTSVLRQILEPDLPKKFPSRYLLVEEGRVTLNLPPGSDVDFETFEDYIRKEEWEAALALYVGEPFTNDRYHSWAIWRREHLIDLYKQALLETAEGYLSVGCYKAALENCKRILTEDPWHEQAALLSMQACEHMNARPEAIRIYLKLAAALQEDLGILPSLELRTYYQLLLK